MESDKNARVKLLASMDTETGLDSDSSASVYYSMRETDNSDIYDDQSTLEAEDSPSSIINATSMESTLKHQKTPIHNSLLGKSASYVSSPYGSGKKILKNKLIVSSTPHLTPRRGGENDLNLVNRETVEQKEDSTKNIEAPNQDNIFTVINQKLEIIKLDIPEKINYRFTSPSNPAYAGKPQNPSPGQLQFEKTANQISANYEDLQAEIPPDVGRPSLAIPDYDNIIPMVHIKTPYKSQKHIFDDETSDMSHQASNGTPEEAFERMIEKMQPTKMDDIVPEKLKPTSAIPSRGTISSNYRKSILQNPESIPGPSNSNMPATTKRAKWSIIRNTHISLPAVAESEVSRGLKKWSPKVDLPRSTASRKSYIPARKSVYSERKEETKPSIGKSRQSLRPSILPATALHSKPSSSNNILSDSAKKRKNAALKIATVNIGNRRSSFGYPVGKPQLRKSIAPRTFPPRTSFAPSALPAATSRRSVMPLQHSKSVPPVSQRTGTIPKPTIANKPLKPTSIQCKYCDKKFAIMKALDDHLTLKCTQIPPKDKKKLLSQERAAREEEVIRRSHSNHTNNHNIDLSEASTISVSGVNSATMPPPSAKSSVPKITKHCGIMKTPSKLIPCEPCGLKFLNVVQYTNHMTTIHIHNNQSPAEELIEN